MGKWESGFELEPLLFSRLLCLFGSFPLPTLNSLDWIRATAWAHADSPLPQPRSPKPSKPKVTTYPWGLEPKDLAGSQRQES